MNGTRGVVVRMMQHSVVVKVASGPSAGKEIYVPRINLQNSGQTKVFFVSNTHSKYLDRYRDANYPWV